MCRHVYHVGSGNNEEGRLSLTTLKKNEMTSNDTCVCPNDECGKSFDHPILLTVLSNDPVETYPACPYCMSRIERNEDPKPEKHAQAAVKIKAALEKEKEKIETNGSDKFQCPHEFGYLKKRQKGSPIPDECLVCQKMIQCLS
jgi:DNA-directed RNA polymerase subunit RPC12/RpoP